MKRSKLVLLIGGCLLTALASWSMELSTVEDKAFAKAAYADLKQSADKNPKVLFIEHLSQKPPYSWPSSLNKAFKDQKITPQDLLFIVEKTNFTKAIEEDSLFHLAILNRLNTEGQKEAMVGLMSLPAIDMKLSYWGPDLKVNFLAALIEKGHILAFETIVAGCPKLDFNPFGAVAVQATSMVDDPDNLGTFINGKKPETVEYSLTAWLMREDQIHLLGRYAKPNYVKAGQAMLLFAEMRPSIEMSPSGLPLLAQFFEKNKMLPENFDYKSFANIKGIKEAAVEQEAEPEPRAEVKEISKETPIVQAEIKEGTKAPTNSPVERVSLELGAASDESGEQAASIFKPLLDFIGL